MTLQGLCAISRLQIQGELMQVITGMAEHCCIEAGNIQSLASYCGKSVPQTIELVQELMDLGLLVVAEAGGKTMFFVCEEDRDYWIQGMGSVVEESSKSIRERVFSRDKFSCRYCGANLERGTPTIDHIVPRCQGGGDDLDNLATCCSTCNSSKGGRTPEQWSQRRNRHERS
jgi:5-methylcytosine-specific restriction endonuclease McrA